MAELSLQPAVVRRLAAERRPDFLDRGLRSRHFFPHEILHLPRPGPDGWLMAERLCPPLRRRRHWEIVLYAVSPILEELPEELWFDDDLVWHQQQFGRPGQVATANLVAVGGRLYGMNYLSDIVQRVSRAPRWRSRIDNRFKGWSQMLLNGVMDFAAERGFRTLYSPTADLALRHTDPARQVRRELFDRVYDAAVLQRVEARRKNDWWVVPIGRNQRRCVRSERVENVPSASAASSGPVVCVLHDVERGWGHLDVDPGFTERADRVGRESLPRMLAVERDLGVRATYNVVGTLLGEIRAEIERDGHALAFHSFDHRLDHADQLARCRGVDYRLPGYRPPRSVLTPELVDGSLVRRGFAWIASAEPAWQRRGPRLEEGLVTIPVHLDDYPLHAGTRRYEEWELALLERVARSPLTVFGLHDCYGDRWLPGYPRLLRRLGEIATFRTLDQISNQAILAAAC